MEDLSEIRKKIVFNSFSFWAPVFVCFGAAAIIPLIQIFYIDRIGWPRFFSVTAFCFLAGAIATFITMRKDIRNRKRWKNLPLLKATVMDCLSAGYSKRNRTYYIPTVKLNYKGQDVTFTASEILRRKKYQKGEELFLFFDPKDPASSFDIETCTYLYINEETN